MVTNLIGRQLGNYRLVKLLGEGGFASVYLGQHVRVNTQQFWQEAERLYEMA